ncbi:MAG: restriction endonuclease subunit S [Chloroflexi bacterium]|nr:MAG: restriction endonuclease subunit S [Chloroflexota bacterium]
MKPYPAYKDSELPWLGKVPQHWETKRLKYVAPMSRVKLAEQPADLPYLGLEHIEAKTGQVLLNDLAEHVESAVSLFDKGNVLFSKLRPYLAKVALAEFRGTCTTELLVFQPGKLIDSKFLFYRLLSQDFIAFANSMTYGAKMPRASSEQISNAVISFPALSEQKVITQLLDYKLCEIDDFIKTKQSLIDLLNEQKMVLTHNAITHGINAHVRLKPSGVRWLGEIPEHWEVKRARYYFREIDERSATGNEELLSVSHITGVTPRSEKNVTMFLAESYEGYKMCQAGDLVINIMWAWMGALGVSAYSGIVSSSYGIYRQKQKFFHWRYLDYLLKLKPYVAEFTARSTGIHSSRLRMYTDDFFDIPIIRPPLAEQERIVCSIEQEHAPIDHAISVAAREIALVQEFRTALISHVITGKVDVRTR